MVRRQQLVNMLIEALSFEEIIVTARLESFLKNVRECKMDKIAGSKIENNIRQMLTDSIRHSQILTALLKEATKK